MSILLKDSLQHDKPGIAARFLRAAQLTAGAGVAARLLLTLLPFLVAKLISRPDFGIFTIVASTVTVGAGLGELGQTATLQRFLPQFAIREPKCIGAVVDTVVAVALCCLLTLAAILILSSRLVAVSLYGDASLVNYLRVAAVILAAAGLFNVLSGILAGLQEFVRFSAAQLVRSCVMLVLGVAAAAVFGLRGALAAQVIGSLAVAHFAGQLASSTLRGICGTRLVPRFHRRFLGMMTGFSLPMFLSAALVLPAYWLAMARLSHCFGVREVAEFGIAFGAMQFVLLVPNVISMTALSFLSESHARSDHTFGSLSNLNLRVAWGLAMMTAVLLAFIAPPLLDLAFGAKYGDIRWLLLYMMMAGLAMAICNSVGSVIASTGKMWQALALNTVWLALFTASFMLLVPRLASQGLALSYFASYALFAIMACFYGRSVCGMSLEKVPSLAALSLLGFAAAAFTMDKWPHFLALTGLLVTAVLAAVTWRMVATEPERDHARLELRSLLGRETAARPARSRPRILYVCHVDWGWIKQRPQHLAEHLRQHFDVTVAFRCNWRRAAMVNDFRISRSCIPLLRVPMRDRFSFLAMLDTLALRISLRLLIGLIRPAYIWLTWPDLYKYLPRRVRPYLIYDCMDDAQAFPREQKRAAILARTEHELVAHAQFVFVSSERLRAVLRSRHGTLKTFHLLRNAFDGKPLSAPAHHRPIRRAYQIGYCGTLATWLDWDLLVKIVDALPGVELHLVGAIDPGAAIVQHEKILWHGPKRHDELPAVMGEFDCLAMPFRVTPLIESVDPVKLYEYISYNKPIIAVYYDEIARFAPFVHFYRTHAEALDLVSRLMTGALDKKYSDTERRTFLAANSWRERASLAADVMQGNEIRQAHGGSHSKEHHWPMTNHFSKPEQPSLQYRRDRGGL